MINDVLARSRRGFFLTRAFDDLAGSTAAVDVGIQIRYSRAALARFVGKIAAAVNAAPADARIEYSVAGITTVPARPGQNVRIRKLQHSLAQMLAHPLLSRETTLPVRRVRPSVSTADLARRYPRVIVIDRAGFQLRLYDNLRLARTYPIAVGMAGLQTPAGLYAIQDRQVDPTWYVPNSAWAGTLAGKVIPPGPGDPLKARWMGFYNGAGIHGIDPSEYSTIGHDASHGCVRMTIPDVISLYDQVSVGTPVYIA